MKKEGRRNNGNPQEAPKLPDINETEQERAERIRSEGFSTYQNIKEGFPTYLNTIFGSFEKNNEEFLVLTPKNIETHTDRQLARGTEAIKLEYLAHDYDEEFVQNLNPIEYIKDFLRGVRRGAGEAGDWQTKAFMEMLIDKCILQQIEETEGLPHESEQQTYPMTPILPNFKVIMRPEVQVVVDQFGLLDYDKKPQC